MARLNGTCECLKNFAAFPGPKLCPFIGHSGCHVDMSWHRSYFGQIMIVLMCHGIISHPCWLHVCQGSKLKYTCQHIDTGSCVGRWPSTGLCHRPRVGEYCASIGVPLPFRSGYYGGRFSCSFFWRSCNPLRFCALFVPCPQAEDSLHEY